MRNKLLKEPRIDGDHLKGWMQFWKTTKTSFAAKTTGWVGSYFSVICARAGKVDEITAEFEHKRKQVGTRTLELRKPCFTRICLACPTSHLLASRTRAANHSHHIPQGSLQGHPGSAPSHSLLHSQCSHTVIPPPAQVSPRALLTAQDTRRAK